MFHFKFFWKLNICGSSRLIHGGLMCRVSLSNICGQPFLSLFWLQSLFRIAQICQYDFEWNRFFCKHWKLWMTSSTTPHFPDLRGPAIKLFLRWQSIMIVLCWYSCGCQLQFHPNLTFQGKARSIPLVESTVRSATNAGVSSLAINIGLGWKLTVTNVLA